MKLNRALTNKPITLFFFSTFFVIVNFYSFAQETTILRERKLDVFEKEQIKGEKVVFNQMNQVMVLEGNGELGAELEILAKDEIIIGPGFEAKEGSEFTAEIDENNSIAISPQIKVIPNPTNNGQFKIELSKTGKGYFNYQILNSLGEITQEGVLAPNQVFNISNHPTGVYFIKVSQRNNSKEFFQTPILYSN